MSLPLGVLGQITDVAFEVLLMVWLAALCAAIVVLPAIAVYRLYYHPLAAHKGPLFARLSGWPNWHHATKGDRHIWLRRLHDQYGPTVRFAPNAISSNTVAAVNAIYRSRTTKVFKSDWYQTVRDFAGGFESTFTARDAERHRIKRGLLSHAFSDRALDDYVPRIHSVIHRWIGCLQHEAGSTSNTVDMGAWTRYLIFDILGDICFGKSFGLLDSDKKNRPVAGLVPKATRVWYTVGHHPLSRALRFVLFKTSLGAILSDQSYRDNSAFRTFCIATFRERLGAEQQRAQKPGPESEDMFHHLLNGRDPKTGEAYSPSDLACESVLLIVAGTHTTATAMAATLFYLANNPSKLAKLRKELCNTFTSASEICHEKLAVVPYLLACINESLRLSPPTPGHLPRTVVSEGLAVDGHWMPRGTTLGVSAYALHRNEAYFDDPDCFRPEQWVAEDGTADAAAFAPFSVGPTGCIGKRLAYIQMSLAVAMFVWHFKFRSEEAASGSAEYSLQDMYIGQGDGPYFTLKRTGLP